MLLEDLVCFCPFYWVRFALFKINLLFWYGNVLLMSTCKHLISVLDTTSEDLLSLFNNYFGFGVTPTT